MAPKTIFLKTGREGEPLPKEAKAEAGTILPGNLVELSSTAGNIKNHATAGGNAAAMFAIEDALQGNEIGELYAINTQVQYICCAPGDEVYAILAQGENVAIGDFLESDGDGALRKYVAQTVDSNEQQTIIPKSIVAIATEALDLSTSSLSDARLKIQVV